MYKYLEAEDFPFQSVDFVVFSKSQTKEPLDMLYRNN